MDQQRKNDLTAGADGIIEGRNAVIEALRAGETIDKIYLQKGETDRTLGHIASTARAAGVVVVEADKRKLDAMSRTHAHQGVIALAAVREYVSVESILSAAAPGLPPWWPRPPPARWPICRWPGCPTSPRSSRT